MKENKIGGIPIVDKDHRLAGILTNRELRFETDKRKLVREAMKKENLVTAPGGKGKKKAEKILKGERSFMVAKQTGKGNLSSQRSWKMLH